MKIHHFDSNDEPTGFEMRVHIDRTVPVPYKLGGGSFFEALLDHLRLKSDHMPVGGRYSAFIMTEQVDDGPDMLDELFEEELGVPAPQIITRRIMFRAMVELQGGGMFTANHLWVFYWQGGDAGRLRDDFLRLARPHMQAPNKDAVDYLTQFTVKEPAMDMV